VRFDIHQEATSLNRHRIARPRPIFSTLPLRCMSPSASATRPHEIRAGRLVILGIEPFVAHHGAAATSKLVTVPCAAVGGAKIKIISQGSSGPARHFYRL
jgi:hypothetical protein